MWGNECCSVEREKEGLHKMPEAKAEDIKEPIPIPLKPPVPAIPTDDEELRELGEDLRIMGCEGLLAQTWEDLRKVGIRIPGRGSMDSREG